MSSKYLYLNAFVECDVGTKANLKLFIYLEETEQYCIYVRIYWIFMLADASFLIYSSMRGGGGSTVHNYPELQFSR